MLGTDQPPHRLAFVLGQRFQDEGNVGRVQPVDQGRQLRLMLAVHQVFHQVGLVVALFLAMDQVFDQMLPAQALLDLGQCVLGVFGVEPAGRRGRLGRGGGLRHATGLKGWAAGGCAGLRRWRRR